MPRRPFSLLQPKSAAPYVPRSGAQRALYTALERLGAQEVLFLQGERQNGVTRTLEEFVRHLPDTRISGVANVAPVVFDLSQHAHLFLPELLVDLRNSVVVEVNRLAAEKRQVNWMDRHFLAFDAIWYLWAGLEFGRQTPTRLLRSSTGATLTEFAAKKGVSLATLGALDLLLGFLDHAVNDTSLAIGKVGVEARAEGWTATRIRKLVQAALPLLLPHIKLPEDLAVAQAVNADTLASQMPAIMAAALANVSRALGDECRLMLVLEAADEVETDDPVFDHNLRALAELLDGVRDCGMTCVLGGRGHGALWRRSLQAHELRIVTEALVDLPIDEVRAAWRASGHEALFDLVLKALAERLPEGVASVAAGELARAWALATRQIAAQQETRA